LPIKVSSATSNVMIGLTAATSAGVYLLRGDIQPLLAAPVALGVAAGAGAGARMLRTMPGPRVRAVFIVVLVWIGAEMLWKGLA
ncbi:MAG TPA: TSUP family transporter, partial [Acidimicrobiales bacterium]|nr:TSUP family transporter [Acidimicrobiales bacterium]